MNLVHLHLLLNHFPTIGTIIALGLMLYALARKSAELKRTALAVFFSLAIVAFPTYMTGYPAQDAVADHPGVSAALIEQHQSAALLGLIFMEATGLVAWFGLWEARRPAGPSAWTTPAMLLLAAATMAVMANAANIGGAISHPEILSGPAATATASLWAPAGLTTRAVTRYQAAHSWAWPLLEILHYVGLSLILGVALVANLRIMGLLKNAALIDIHRLLPWGVWGFVINAVSGMMFYAGPVDQYDHNIAFHMKILFLLFIGADVLYLTMSDEVWSLGPGEEAPRFAKLVAGAQVCLWVGVIFYGRMLPYLGNSF